MKTDKTTRLRWFHQARFGMFIHWGLYSLLGRGEWVMLHERIRAGDYARLADRFTAKKFDADAWAGLAAEAGMKYMVLTTRHHDGFCLYDSAASDFTAVKTAARRDFVAEYARACRRAGLKVGFYYSLLDWRFPGYWDARRERASAQAMVRQVHDQMRELMSNYGRIDYLFYDGAWIPGFETPHHADGKLVSTEVAAFWQSRKLNRMVRRLQPHIVINNRAAVAEDVDTPEQEVTASAPHRAWESCMTIGDRFGWGYLQHNPNRKIVPQILQHLATAASGRGNFLLNIGPRGDGSIPREDVRILRQIGEWMAVNGEGIYGSQRCPLQSEHLGSWTRRGNTAYFHIFRYPGTEAAIPLVATRARSARLLADGTRLKIQHEYNGRLILSGLPHRPPHPYVNTVKIRFTSEPKSIPFAKADRPKWLEGA